MPNLLRKSTHFYECFSSLVSGSYLDFLPIKVRHCAEKHRYLGVFTKSRWHGRTIKSCRKVAGGWCK
nr:MAG TPA: hypothetical protein [Bacteriophage sp.]